jgi:AraC-like DNA-binding protein
MPFAPAIRKEILQALETSIIPALWKQQVPLGYVAPPLRFPPGITQRLLSSKLPRADAKPLDFPIQSRWTKAKLHSTHYPYLSFIYEGIADERTLLTAAQAEQYNVMKGIYALRWEAPGVLLFPSGAPHNTGKKVFWEDASAHCLTTKILQVILYDELLVHITQENAQEHVSTHSLEIKDAPLRSLAKLFCGELHHAPVDKQDAAQAVLLALMLRLRNYLYSHPTNITNTAYPPVSSLPSSNERHNDIWRDTVEFIQMHLHEELTLSLIAQRAGLSPVHLNRLFHQFSGVSVMRYVRLQRMTSAKMLLVEAPENITEIARLMGFRDVATFCRTFLRETGLTPNQYRHQKRR